MMSKKWTPGKVTVDEEINTLRERERKERERKEKTTKWKTERSQAVTRSLYWMCDHAYIGGEENEEKEKARKRERERNKGLETKFNEFTCLILPLSFLSPSRAVSTVWSVCEFCDSWMLDGGCCMLIARGSWLVTRGSSLVNCGVFVTSVSGCFSLRGIGGMGRAL